MADVVRLRDQLAGFLPWWLKDRSRTVGKWTGYRFMWALIAPLDVYSEWALQALQAPWPGLGTSSALPYVGRTRGIMRGQADTDATYAAKLLKWLDKWRRAGSMDQLATELHEYLGNSPKVRIVDRAGQWVTVAADGTITKNVQAFNWDGTSNPERAGYWSELFIIIYPSQWSTSQTWGDGRTYGGRDGGLGHKVSRVEYDAVKSLIAQWKAAHSFVRAIVWTTDSTLFDPTTPASLPNGSWGEWATHGGSVVAGARNVSTCRYWEF